MVPRYPCGLFRAASFPMEPLQTCQCCRRPAEPADLRYSRSEVIVHKGSLLQCDVCERYACPECLRVYDILSGYDFLCDACARELGQARQEVASR